VYYIHRASQLDCWPGKSSSPMVTRAVSSTTSPSGEGSSIDKLAGLFYPAGWHALVVGAGG
jgi:hypothetical protein